MNMDSIKPYEITRRIEIDAGHRVPLHASKCKNIHGHRYVIQATAAPVENRLVASGEEKDMVMDFGFMKDAMMNVIDKPCDHGLMISRDDRALMQMFIEPDRRENAYKIAGELMYCAMTGINGQKLYVMRGTPTAEVLAEVWGTILNHEIRSITNDRVHLLHIDVWETPNCVARFTCNS